MILLFLFSLRFVAVGDILLDRGVRRYINKNGIKSLFSDVDSIIKSADVSMCNLESPITKTGIPINKPYCFRGEPEYLEGVYRAGFNVFNIANNHTIDWGKKGFLNTMRNIERTGGYYTGGGRFQKEAEEPLIISHGGITIAIFGAVDLFDPEVVKALKYRPGPYCLDAKSLERYIKFIRPLVDYIILTIHWGKEYEPFPEQKQVELAHKLVDAGVDIIIGHHPHVLQGIEIYKNKIILYSLGNFVFDQKKDYQRETVIFRCTLTETGIKDIEFVPIFITDCQPRIPDRKMSNIIKNRIITLSSIFGTGFIESGERLFLCKRAGEPLIIQNSYIAHIPISTNLPGKVKIIQTHKR